MMKLRVKRIKDLLHICTASKKEMWNLNLGQSGCKGFASSFLSLSHMHEMALWLSRKCQPTGQRRKSHVLCNFRRGRGHFQLGKSSKPLLRRWLLPPGLKQWAKFRPSETFILSIGYSFCVLYSHLANLYKIHLVHTLSLVHSLPSQEEFQSDGGGREVVLNWLWGTSLEQALGRDLIQRVN